MEKRNTIRLKIPYNKELNSKLKDLGGRWAKEEKEWVIPEAAREETNLLVDAFFPNLCESDAIPGLEEDRSMKHRVDEIVKSSEALYSGDTLERMVSFAYSYGRESAAREVSNKYADLIRAMKKRAEQSRYRHVALEAIGDKEHLFFEEYSLPITKRVGPMDTNL